MNHSQAPAHDPARNRRGQTMAEFALTLPILLLLMFGVIEFARIFHAWVTLQNAARAAARYAITGRWDEDVVESVIGYTSAATDPLLRREDILNNLVPCTTAHDELFYNHWGHDCDPTDDEDQACGRTWRACPRLWIRARIGAASLALKDGEQITGLVGPYGEINSETVGKMKPAGFTFTFVARARRSTTATRSPASDRRVISPAPTAMIASAG